MARNLNEVNMMHAFPEVAFGENYIIGTYQIVTSTKNIEKLALAIADEQTTGTWIAVAKETSDKKRRFGAKVVSIYQVPDMASDGYAEEESTYIVQIAFPATNFGANIPMILSTIFGNIASSGKIKWLDCAMPKSYVEQFKGPKFGVEGLRKLLNVYDRPLLNAMIKPNVGWTPEEGAELFYEAARGGVDVIKDDELLSANMDFCPLAERVPKFMEMERRAFEETGEHTLYAVNITDSVAKLKDNAHRALDLGANCLMINYYTVGFDAAKMIADDPDINVPILAHVDYAGAQVSSTFTGVSAPLLMAKILRLAGADFAIYGTPWGKFPVSQKLFERGFRFFTQDWWNIKPCMMACSGGTTQFIVNDCVKSLGIDMIMAAGGAVHGHPDGSFAGAKSMRQAIDAAVKGIDLFTFAETHSELQAMIDHLGGKASFDLMK
ncbi:MAG: RuBisCO large subunit C-terminal-like domain-containing protein [Oscillospiraceae bacterium]|nr:RuBisCO large subunit C-terminal-like domain-containing protein [Oscillospiraceae bacterium]